MPSLEPPTRRRRRRAVGPPGARATDVEVRLSDVEPEASPSDDERLLADRPPHHDRGV